MFDMFKQQVLVAENYSFVYLIFGFLDMKREHKRFFKV
jgi:hypothetical protein